MRETFACPHCGTQFPLLTCLVQRKVRCSACRKPFRLRRDGLVDALTGTAHPPATDPESQAPPAPVVKPTTAPPPRTATDEELLKRTWDWVEGEQNRRELRETRNRTIGVVDDPQLVTKRHDAVRARLRLAAEQAAAKQQGADSSRSATALDAPHEVFLSGSGERRRPVLRLLVIVLALVAALGWLLNRSQHPVTQALAAYAATDGATTMIERLDRAWIGSLDGRTTPLVLGDIGRPTITALTAVDLANLQDLLINRMRNMVPLHQLGCFVHADDRNALRRLADDPRARRTLGEMHEQAESEGLRLISYQALIDELHDRGYSGRTLHCLALLLVGDPADARKDSIVVRWLSHEPPVAMEIAEVEGHDAQALIDVGNGLRQRPVDAYRAILVRFRGGAQAEVWRVLDCYREGDLSHLDNLLEQRYQIARRARG